MLHAVIMAGGSGTRFWPASTQRLPKQLLKLYGDQTMIQSTVNRLGSLVRQEDVLVVTNERLVEETQKQLPEIPKHQIVGEPAKRDTAPCIGLAAAMIAQKDPEGIMLVMPADHVIQQADNFQNAIKLAVKTIRSHPGRFVTFGIKPTYPAESFGYVERGESQGTPEEGELFAVKTFREKPDKKTATEFLDSGNFYWNSGIFVWTAKSVFSAIEKHQPEMHSHLKKIQDAIDTQHFDQVFETEFKAINGTSIDYAIMEHYDDISVMEAPFDWDDVGTWQAVGRLIAADRNGNSTLGKTINLETNNSIIHAEEGHLVATLGLEDCIVVQTGNATLVAHKSKEESIRALVKEIETNQWNEFL
ncbi:MAG: mannose-1-phosphate guanylyltransferase [Planctomycetota bacterium]|nr:mannose-1-phosphate guanylyltransferase [Planctomycetota bacterium]